MRTGESEPQGALLFLVLDLVDIRCAPAELLNYLAESLRELRDAFRSEEWHGHSVDSQ